MFNNDNKLTYEGLHQSTSLWLVPLVLSVLLLSISQSHFLLFHTLAEFFAIMVALLFSLVAWQMYPFTKNNFLMYLGCGYFWVAALDLLHALNYSGMSIFPGTSINSSTQFWVVTRYLETILLLSAPLFFTRLLNRAGAFLLFGLVAVCLSALIMADTFPETFIKGKGLTDFKIYSEYIIISLLIVAIIFLRSKRAHIDRFIMNIMTAAIALTMGAELAFTFYVDLYGLSNIIGHIFKLFSFWLIYVAVVQTTLKEPFVAMARGAYSYDAMPDATIIVDNNGIIRQANNAAARLADKDKLELIGQGNHAIFHSQDTDIQSCPVCQCAINNKAQEIIELENKQRWFDISISPVSGTLAQQGTVQVLRDITDKKTAGKQVSAYSAILEHSINEVYFFDQESLKFTQASDGALKNLGYSMEEMRSKTPLDIKPEYSEESFRELLQPLVDGETDRLTFETIHRRRDGTTYPVEVHLQLAPINKHDHQFMAIILDITERNQAGEKLRRHQQRLEQILDNMVDGVISIDESGIIQNFNKSAETIFGYSVEEVTGGNINMLLPEPDRHRGIDKYINAGEENIIGAGHEMMAQRKNGEIFPLRLSVAELPPTTDGKRYFIGSCVDISLQKRQEEQIRRGQKMDALGKLTGGIAHDYNNLLCIMLGFLEILQHKLSGQPELQTYVDKIQHAGERGAKLTSKLLSFSRQKPAEAEPVNINQLILDEQHVLEKTLTARIRLALRLTDEPWLSHLDSGDFESCLLNLSINAMHAMPDGGELTLHTSNEVLGNTEDVEAGEYVTLSVVDNGHGMDTATLERIFDPFYTTKGEEGTGLGLSQVYSFVRRSGGMVKVYSEIDVGTRFVLYFPRYLKEQDPLQEKTTIENTNPGGSETILIVDDEASLRDMTCEVLTQHGYRALCAGNAREALEILESESIDALLSDVIMPTMDGYELAAIVEEKYPAIKIQLASGFDDNRHLGVLGDNLHQHILYKPYKAEALLKRIRALLDE